MYMLSAMSKRFGRKNIRSTTCPSGWVGKDARSARRSRAGRAVTGHAMAHGQTLVEFAMVLTVFMLVTVGLLDGMRVIFYYSQVQEAAREGARWGAVQVARAVPISNTEASSTQ